MSNHPVQSVTTSNDKIKVALAVSALVAGVVGFYLLPNQSGLVRTGVLLAGLVVAVFFALLSSHGKEFVAYAKDSVRETKKVVWPTRKEALQMTGIVFAFVVVMAIFLWGTDKLLELLLYDLILGWKN